MLRMIVEVGRARVLNRLIPRAAGWLLPVLLAFIATLVPAGPSLAAAPIHTGCNGVLPFPLPSNPESCRGVLNQAAPVDGCYVIEPLGYDPYETWCDFRTAVIVLVDNKDTVPSNAALNNPPATKAQQIEDELIHYFDTVSYGRLVLMPEVVWDPVDPADPNDDAWYQLEGQAIGWANNDIFAQVIADYGVNFHDHDLIITYGTADQDGIGRGNALYLTRDVITAAGTTQPLSAYYIVTRAVNVEGDVLLHEVGHTLFKDSTGPGANVKHSNATSSIDGSSTEYGDTSDLMGVSGNHGHLSAPLKYYLDYLPDDVIENLAPGATDDMWVSALGHLSYLWKAGKISLGGSDSYWVEARRDVDTVDNALPYNLTDGVLVKKVHDNNANPPQVTAQDGTPETPNDKLLDGALLPGRTFSDYDNDIHISVLEADFLESLVYVAAGSGNPAPALGANPVSVTPCAGTGCFDYTAVFANASDYLIFWNFEVGLGEEYEIGDYAYGENATHTFADPGGAPWRVWMIVSDMGGSEAWYPFEVDVNGVVTAVPTTAPAVTAVTLERKTMLKYRLVPEFANDDGLFLQFGWNVPDDDGDPATYSKVGFEQPQVNFKNCGGAGTHDATVEVTVGRFPGGLPERESGTPFSFEVARQWTNMGTFPGGGRSQHAMAYHVADQDVIVFGGRDATTTFGDTWRWHAGAWEQVPSCGPGGAPPARSHHTLTYHPDFQQIVMFGGSDAGGTKLGDTWVWDGGCWTELLPAGNTPSVRSGHGMAYDTKYDQLVLFGGRDANGALADTWRWDGVGWLAAAPLTPPDLRSGHMMADNLDNKSIVLFGGTNQNWLDDTWKWSGPDQEWADVTPSNPQAPYGAPVQRRNAAMAYDKHAEVVVMFGGENAMGMLGDTWEWLGANWIDMSPASGAPSARRGAEMVWVDQHGALALMGGFDGTNYLDDVWISFQ